MKSEQHFIENRGGGQFVLASPTPISGVSSPCLPVMYAHDSSVYWRDEIVVISDKKCLVIDLT